MGTLTSCSLISVLMLFVIVMINLDFIQGSRVVDEGHKWPILQIEVPSC